MREKSCTKKQLLYLNEIQKTIQRNRNIVDEFSFHFAKELPANGSHFQIYEQFILI